MTAIAFVQGVLLAAIIATWMWTWWWNRYVVTARPEADYEAAFDALTLELVAWRGDIESGAEPESMYWPVTSRRWRMTRRVVDAAFAADAVTTGEMEVVK